MTWRYWRVMTSTFDQPNDGQMPGLALCNGADWEVWDIPISE